MRRLLARLSRASTHLRAAAGLLAALALPACVADPAAIRYPSSGVAIPSQAIPLPNQARTGTRVALLLPLTGPAAEVGQAMLKAAQLSFDRAGSPPLDQQDTGGTPDGAATAVRAALAAGAGLILGPLTAPETNAAAPIARAAGVPMLAFTSDSSLAQPGVWTLGITPAQQVRRLVLAVQAENKTRIAAVLPENPFGDALATGLLAAASAAGLPEPRIRRTPPTFAGLNDALKDITDYPTRHPGADAFRPVKPAPDAQPTPPPAAPPPPAPMDVLFLGITGELLGQAVPMLAYYDVAPNQVRILGPATWVRDAARLPNLAGAWYAAPEPAQRAPFERQYTARFSSPARDFTSIAYDAAGIARAAAADGFTNQALIRPEGFAGADGLIALLPDGQVRRGLAIFEVDRGGAHVVQPSPTTLAAPGT